MTFSSTRKPAIFAALLALCAGDLDVAAGLSFKGKAPDLGAFEFGVSK